MSRLRLPSGDDHPEAAEKHLHDAGTLLSEGRPDGAGYLSGYVVECSLKAVLQFETGTAAPLTHRLTDLLCQLQTTLAHAGARTGRYLGAATSGLASSSIVEWRETMRYHAPSMTSAAAGTWHTEARAVFQETVHQMRLDGSI